MSSAVLDLAARRERQRAHEAARADHARTRARVLGHRLPEDELRRRAEQGARELADADSDTILAWVAEHFPWRVAVASSMANTVLPHVVSRHLPWVHTLFLDTGYHFAETLGTRAAAEAALEITVVDVTPSRDVAAQDRELGPDLFARDPEQCCRLRKVEPLHAALADYEVWITGVRRDEGPTRAATAPVLWDERNRLIKVNPLVDWTFDDVQRHALEHGLPVNPLLADGYPSIGCAPCTQRVAPGADPRSGRWAGTDKTECGLHA